MAVVLIYEKREVGEREGEGRRGEERGREGRGEKRERGREKVGLLHLSMGPESLHLSHLR